MGRYVFKLPDVGEGTAEAEIAAWHVGVGDRIEEDQPLVDVTTDKAVVEIPAPVSGRVISLHGAAGELVAVGSDLVVFDVEGEENADAAKTQPVEAPSPAQTPRDRPAHGASATTRSEAKPKAIGRPPEPRSDIIDEPPAVRRVAEATAPALATRTPGEKPVAAPAVRRRARELGVELQFVPGSGPGGRITHADLDAYLSVGAAVPREGREPALPKQGIEEHKVIGIRRKIAERMQEAKRRIPHFSYIEEVDMTALEALRLHLNARYAQRPKLTLLPFLMRALVATLPEHPEINARFDDDNGVVHRHEGVHVGIATQTPNGLVVPVVRHAEARDLWGCAAEVARLANAAREGKATREELTGSTITITSLGAIGGVATTPVINYPEVAIVGVNKLIERPVIHSGQIVVRKMMNLSCSFDHRVVDGWNAAEFVQKLRAFLEQPATLFID
jgi:2-oxoisovalerate dehydrogenase E2 component (dihydrolipoyl transacylase)